MNNHGENKLRGERRRRALISSLLGAATLGLLMMASTPKEIEAQNPAQESETNHRRVPQNRNDFRGEHTGVIYTPSGYRRLNRRTGPIDSFTPHRAHEDLSLYIGYGGEFESKVSELVILGASYEIVRKELKPMEGIAVGPHWESRAREELVPGEYVEVYHPAVYQQDDEGRMQLVEKEETTREPKVRIILERVWVEGSPKSEGEK